MLPGGGKGKGSAFERETGYALSRWISKGARDDLFCRTVLSGGQYTSSGRGCAGDLMPNDMLAKPFCDKFVIECKHWQDLDYYLHSLLLRKELLYDAMYKLNDQARAAKKHWFFVVKQNRRAALLMTSYTSAFDTQFVRIYQPVIGSIVVTTLQTFLKEIPYELICPPKEEAERYYLRTRS